MGSKLTSEQKYINNCFKATKYPDKKWKEFVFKFETKYFVIDDFYKYKIEWLTFERIFFSKTQIEIEKGEETLENYVLYNTLRTMFLKENDKIRAYRVYMIFFPFVYHHDKTKFVDMLELIFDNIIYFLELEIQRKSDIDERNNKDRTIEEPDDNRLNTQIEKTNKVDEKLLAMFGSVSNSPIIRSKTLRLKLYDHLENENNQNDDEGNSPVKILIDENSDVNKQIIKLNSCNHLNLPKNEVKINKIHYRSFYQILYTLFDTFVVSMLTNFNDLIVDVDKPVVTTVELPVVNNINVEEIKVDMTAKYKIELKKFDVKNLKLEVFTEEKIKEFLNHTFTPLRKRKNILDQNIMRFEDLFFTMEDVNFYFRNNDFFFNPETLMEKYLLSLI